MKRFGAVMLATAAIGLAACQDAVRPVDDGPILASAGGNQIDVVVVLNDGFAPGGHGANRALAAEVALGLGIRARHAYGTALFGFSAAVPEGRLRALGRDPRVKYVQRDRSFAVPVPRAQAPPWCADRPDHPACGGGGGGGGQTVPWGVARIGADVNANEGTGIHVYVIDTGIDSDHPDLRANIGNGFAATACKGSRRICKEAWDDDHGHGTHVSGTIGAIDNDRDVIGVAAEVTLHAVKVCDKSGFCSGSDIIAGIDWAANETTMLGAATAANMSLGGGGSKTATCNDDGTFTGADAEHEALCNARHVGVVFAVAAGNDGADAQNTTPAAYDDAVMAV
ncbi:MAG: S8 family serine peptidase, partial [Gemmatimonadales bacterium]